ncbi:MAG: sugar transferase [Dysgonamonadaceae bacterium]|jgi:lipopolysaccharide/colanic/teichoic acid biosynthesis glycosyltransferase|nr:sugar transferase [Dysgonamonadaceae bacterium]
MYAIYLKRIIDVTVSIAVLIILLPIFVAIIIVLSINNNGKIFFIQERTGKNCQPFKIIKFKTMTDFVNNAQNMIPDSMRITKTGKFLRRFSMDELPQLINVVAGRMSLIGPRPLPVDYLPMYSETQQRRHSIRPGITGWAQVNGRNLLTWEEKFKLDVWYVDNICFTLDIKILMRTIKSVISQKGVYYGKEPTIGRFNGVN